MADQVKVKVLRHLNDGEFAPGDIRELDRADADRLVASGAVSLVKAEPALKNKMKTASANKSAPARKAK